MQTETSCVLMRGGTSKGPFFLAPDLPSDPKDRDDVLLAAMGSPHEYQVDGIGGGNPLTSKVAIISKSKHPEADVDYLFAQVMVHKRLVDTKPNCGNMLVAVGPFSIESGLVPAAASETTVRIYNVNTNSLVESIVQTPDARVTYDGNARIDGVAGTAAPVKISFKSAAGTVTGKLFPTARPLDVIDGIDVNCVDMAMPMILMSADQFGKTGHQSAAELDADRNLSTRMEAVRIKAGALMGLGDVSKLVVPKIGQMLKPRFAACMFSTGLMMLGAGIVCGQDYPTKPIRIVTAAAGGGSDFTARQIAQGLTTNLGWQVIVENRASGVVSAEVASKAPPDGYTLVVQGAALWTFPLLQKAPYDAVRDFSPISLISREVFIVVVHPSLPAKSVKELIVLAKARPGELNYASSGIGGPQHLGTELFKSMTGVNIVNVPYKGAAASITAVISGEMQLMIADSGVVAPHVKSGKLRALAVTSAVPSALVPGLPTVAASGLPGYEWVGMTHLMAPAKTPAAIINRLNQEIVRYLSRAEVKEQFLNAGSEIVASSPGQLGATIKSQIARMTQLIKDAGIRRD